MGMSFKVAPGVRVRASSRGISAGVGPRAARVHVGPRGVGVSTGVGPFSAYSHLGGGGKSTRRVATRPVGRGPTQASIRVRERELREAELQADQEKLAAIERKLVSVHAQAFPAATRVELPLPDDVDPDPIRDELERKAGIPELVASTGGGEQPPLAAAPEPVDRYALMREHRRRRRAGIPIWRVRDRIDAAATAGREAEQAAAAETERRLQGQRAEQNRLDDLWGQLGQARAQVADELTLAVAAERERREAGRRAEQAGLDEEWERLRHNDPAVTIASLERAFADNEAPAAPIDCEDERVTVVLEFPLPEAIIPERKPARTPTGRATLKKRTKTETNTLYLQALGSNVLATVKEAFAVAPGTQVVQILVIRHEIEGKQANQWVAIYVGEFDRTHYERASGSGDPAETLRGAPEATLNLKGQSHRVAPLDLTRRNGLEAVLEQVASGLSECNPVDDLKFELDAVGPAEKRPVQRRRREGSGGPAPMG